MAEHELKFVLDAVYSDSLIKYLMGRCQLDSEYPSGIISSVYYDTVDWNLLDEKVNSDYLKTKYRLRWYQDVESNSFSPNAYFEKKEKIGSSRKKSRVILPMCADIKERKNLNSPYFLQLPMEVRRMGIHIARSLVPAFQISYRRFRFFDKISGARLAVDTAITVPRVNPHMVKRRKETCLQQAVFECKSNKLDLPDWLHGVSVLGCRKGAFSKYESCYLHITGSVK